MTRQESHPYSCELSDMEGRKRKMAVLATTATLLGMVVVSGIMPGKQKSSATTDTHKNQQDALRSLQEEGEDQELVLSQIDFEVDDLDELDPMDEVLTTYLDNQTLPQNETDLVVFVPIMEGLSSFTIEDIQIVDSPQQLAYQWLLEDPNLEDNYQDALRQRFAMAVLWFSTNGELWNNTQNWLSYNHSICEWYSSLEEEGMDLSQIEDPTMITAISKFGEDAPPETPCDKNNPETIKHLWLIENNLQGQLPRELAHLTELQTVYLSDNFLTGQLPDDIYQWSQLERIDISQNTLQGSIAPEIGRTTNLEYLQFQNNELGDKLPSELGLLTNLTYFNFGNNRRNPQPNGPLPSEIGLLTNLEHFLLPYSFVVTGPLPEELFSLPNLQHLDLKGQRLNSNLSTLVGQLSSLHTLQLSQSGVKGELPSELGNLTNLINFNAELNDFSGQIPSEVGQMTSLMNFLICNTELMGTIPPEMANMTALDDLHLCGNNIKGTIPAELGALTRLTHLTFIKTLLNGTVPDELSALTAMDALELQNTDLTGTVPEEVCKAAQFILADCETEIVCDCCVQCF